MTTHNKNQELSKYDDIKNESNNGNDVKPTKNAESNKTNLGKKNSLTQEKKSKNPITYRLKKHRNM